MGDSAVRGTQWGGSVAFRSALQHPSAHKQETPRFRGDTRRDASDTTQEKLHSHVRICRSLAVNANQPIHGSRSISGWSTGNPLPGISRDPGHSATATTRVARRYVTGFLFGQGFFLAACGHRWQPHLQRRDQLGKDEQRSIKDYALTEREFWAHAQPIVYAGGVCVEASAKLCRRERDRARPDGIDQQPKGRQPDLVVCDGVRQKVFFGR
jgi:hypothetical protein